MLFSKKPRIGEFEAAALPHMNDLYRTAARALGDGARADDVIQDVYLQAWKSFDKFEAGTNCRAWLFKILFHTMNHYRRKWLNIRMVKESEEILEFTAASDPPAAGAHYRRGNAGGVGTGSAGLPVGGAAGGRGGVFL